MSMSNGPAVRDRFVHVGRMQLAAASRKPGFVEAYMKVGKVVQRAGAPFIQLSDADYQGIRKQFAMAPAAAPVISTAKTAAPITPQKPFVKQAGPIVQQRRKFGLGDLVAKVATPIAKALNMDCVDKTTGQLKPDSDCAQRKAALNKIHLP